MLSGSNQHPPEIQDCQIGSANESMDPAEDIGLLSSGGKLTKFWRALTKGPRGAMNITSWRGIVNQAL
jgi:hypothetical protein